MHTHTTITGLVALSIPGLALAGDIVGPTGPDLVFTDAEITMIADVGTQINIDYSFTIQNIGGADVDLEGPNDLIDNDNVNIQAYLSDTEDLSGTLLAASGFAIFDATVLMPGDSYSGALQANSLQLDDPTDLGEFCWLVLEIGNTPEGTPELGNNRTVIKIVPAPSALALLCLGAFAAPGRRR